MFCPHHNPNRRQYEVANGDTRLGYADWCAAKSGETIELRIRWGESPRPRAKPTIYSFASAAERDTFLQGVAAGEGWQGYQIVSV